MGAAAKKLALDAAKFLEEEEIKQKQKETITVYGSQSAKIDKFEKAEEEVKEKVSEEMFMTEEQIEEKKKKFGDLRGKASDIKIEPPEDKPVRRKAIPVEEEHIMFEDGLEQESAPELPMEIVETVPEEEEPPEEKGPEQKKFVSDEFAEKEKKPIEEEKSVIQPADLPSSEAAEEDGESEEEESSEDDDNEWSKKPKKSKAEAFLEKTKKKKPEEKKIEIKPADLKKKSKFEEMKNKANVKVDIPTEQPIRRKKKAPVVEEEVPFLKEEEVESAPPVPKDKVSDEFSEKEAKPKEDEKVVIEPKELPTKEKEDEEESEEESSSDEDNEWSKKPKKSKAEAFLEKTKKKKPEEKKI